MSTVRVRPGTLLKLLWVNDLRELLCYDGISVLPRFWTQKRLKNNTNSENSRKIAAKNSEQFVKTYNFEMFTKWHDMLPQNMPILCGIYQILALSAEYRPYFDSSSFEVVGLRGELVGVVGLYGCMVVRLNVSHTTLLDENLDEFKRILDGI